MTRRVAAVLALVLGLSAVGCTTSGGGPATAPVPSTTGPHSSWLDGSRLPKPVSTLRRVGRLVAYLTRGATGEPRLVAVDPDTGSVSWSTRAAVSEQPPGVQLGLGGVRGDLLLLAPNEAGGPDLVERVDASGRVVWATPVAHPQRAPDQCGAQVCVATAGGTVLLAADDGSATRGATLPARAQEVDAEGSQSLAVVPGATTTDRAATVLGLPRRNSQAGWQRTLGQLFGADQVTSYMGWDGRRYDGTWVLMLAHVSEFAAGQRPDFPYRQPGASVAAFSTRDGAPRWHRTDVAICEPFTSARSLVLCSPNVTYPSADGLGTSMVSSLTVIDPRTGRTTFRVDLDEPLDLFSTEHRLLRLGGDRWLLRDGAQASEVDFATRTRVPASVHTIGWCEARTDLAAVTDSTGKEFTYADPGFLHPCVPEGRQPDRRQLEGAVVRGDLGQPNDWSVASAGRWVVWVEDGRLTGVATKG